MIIYDDKKAQILKLERDIDIDGIVELIIERKYIDILEHPKREASRYLYYHIGIIYMLSLLLLMKMIIL